MEATALGHLLDEKNHTPCLNCKSSRLMHLAFWTIYLIFLRALHFLPQCISLSPQWFQAHITKVESRIVNIAISIVQIVSGREISYSSFCRNNYRSSRQRDGGYEGSIISTGPADNLMTPGDSSLETNFIPPAMFAHQPDIAYLRPQAPLPPYLRRNYENSRRSSSLISPLPYAIHANGRRRNNAFQMQSRSLDRAVSPALFAEPIPRMPVPPIPAFIARMPFVSVSDSIYSSSCSTQLPAASSGVQTYIDLLPGRSFEDSDTSRQANASAGNNAGGASSVPAHFRPDAQHGTLAAVAQHYTRRNYRRSRNARSSSAPVLQNTVKDSKL
ncbi:uncharacterized protein BHQ10_004575 [Talaromyces amestolkiae]|uniref:Uncharacterized protein n=1 Tax=Talaromyces amestolkiae TaxID=1196081 RepID=A0A364KYC6_TALAM|nr:uncharacterized protein BHQ10_004575 [Talaromyces amestolkiae]RAO68563.1 hypothetical protein BHQ10_004575 [Talaromyces amestolkiae]